MDCIKTGSLIYRLRKEKNMTQKEVADLLNISDKAVSKWERGLGCPDVSLLPELSAVLGVNIEEILTGDINQNDIIGGNMKKISIFVCPDCGNIITSTGNAAVSCCGKKLEPSEAVKADKAHQINVEIIENEYFITAGHEMSKEHYISFVAFVTSDTVVMKKQYPEWNMQTYIHKFGHGKLLWYCTKHGLFYQLI